MNSAKPALNLKQERIDIRTSSKIKQVLIQAAELVGSSMSAFVLETAYEKAKKILQENSDVHLSDNERDHFLTLLERPARRNTTLHRAMKNYLENKHLKDKQ